MPEDKELLRGMRNGDADALRQIYEKYREDLFTIAVSLLHDVHVCEDCLQDVFVSFAESAARFKVRSNLKGYLVSCVANRVRDHLRKKTTRLDCPLEELSSLAISDDPADGVIEREKMKRFFEALATLPYEQQEVFVLHVQGGLKFREIAKLQNVSTKTALSRNRYAIEKLRALLEKENGNEV